MIRFFIAVLFVCICNTPSIAQQLSISGTVVNEKNVPLVGATVYCATMQQSVLTNNTGQFSFNNLPQKQHIIEVSYIGYAPYIDTIWLRSSVELRVQLRAQELQLHTVTVHAHSVQKQKHEEALPLEVVRKEFITENMQGSIMKSLSRIPGVSTIDIGSGQSKPIIRGLGFNRVVVVEHGIKHESQQWGADHGLEIDQYNVEQVEIIKGPAALSYGSDAIGGLIHIKPAVIPAEQTLSGTLDITGKTNSMYAGSSVYVIGRGSSLFGSIRITGISYGDFNVPTDSVEIYSYKAPLHNNAMRNTAGNEANAHAMLGYIRNNVQSRLYASFIQNTAGFFANAHGLEPRNIDYALHDASYRDIQYPYQQVQHKKLVWNTLVRHNMFLYETNIGYQHNIRNEYSIYVPHGYMPTLFPDTVSFASDLERGFNKHIVSGNGKVKYMPHANSTYTLGISSDFQDNSIDGRGFIIPAYTQFQSGVFGLLSHTFQTKHIVQAGIRYDYGSITTNSYYDWFQSPVYTPSDTLWVYAQRAHAEFIPFSNVTWQLGYSYLHKLWHYKLHVGKGFRMPIAKELAANGVNYHQFSYETGNINLSPEISYQLDAVLEYHGARLKYGVSPFVNYFTNYIYLNPSAEYDRLYGNGNQIFYYTQAEVLRYGSELSSSYALTKSIEIGILGEYVYSIQTTGSKRGYTLPFSPPASAIFTAKYTTDSIAALRNVYVSADYKISAAQHAIVPPEETTKGYTVLSLQCGTHIPLKTSALQVSLQIQNVLNTNYLNHTNYYRLIHVPEPSRTLVLHITIPVMYNIKTSKK